MATPGCPLAAGMPLAATASDRAVDTSCAASLGEALRFADKRLASLGTSTVELKAQLDSAGLALERALSDLEDTRLAAAAMEARAAAEASILRRALHEAEGKVSDMVDRMSSAGEYAAASEARCEAMRRSARSAELQCSLAEKRRRKGEAAEQAASKRAADREAAARREGKAEGRAEALAEADAAQATAVSQAVAAALRTELEGSRREAEAARAAGEIAKAKAVKEAESATAEAVAATAATHTAEWERLLSEHHAREQASAALVCELRTQLATAIDAKSAAEAEAAEARQTATAAEMAAEAARAEAAEAAKDVAATRAAAQEAEAAAEVRASEALTRFREGSAQVREAREAAEEACRSASRAHARARDSECAALHSATDHDRTMRCACPASLPICTALTARACSCPVTPVLRYVDDELAAMGALLRGVCDAVDAASANGATELGCSTADTIGAGAVVGRAPRVRFATPEKTEPSAGEAPDSTMASASASGSVAATRAASPALTTPGPSNHTPLPAATPGLTPHWLRRAADNLEADRQLLGSRSPETASSAACSLTACLSHGAVDGAMINGQTACESGAPRSQVASRSRAREVSLAQPLPSMTPIASRQKEASKHGLREVQDKFTRALQGDSGTSRGQLEEIKPPAINIIINPADGALP